MKTIYKLKVPILKDNEALWAPVPYSISSYSSSRGGGWVVGNGGGSVSTVLAVALVARDTLLFSEPIEVAC